MSRAPAALLLALLAALLPATAPAQDAPRPAAPGRHAADPDWPCPQRLVPALSPGGLWPGLPAVDEAAWRADPAVAALVARAAPRAVEPEAGLAAIAAFRAGLPADPDAAGRARALAFAALFAETDRQRADLIEQVRRFTRRQREVAALAGRLTSELNALPREGAAEARAELEQRRFYATKAFEDADRTLRFACEAPVRLEGRLGDYARALRAE